MYCMVCTNRVDKCRCTDGALNEAQAEIARLQTELAEANACHETALNLARAGTEHIVRLQAEVERLRGVVRKRTEEADDADYRAHTAWNDAIEAAAQEAQEHKSFAKGIECLPECIRALRRSAP